MKDQRPLNDGPTPSVSVASRSPPGGPDVANDEPRPYPPFTRLAIVTGILLPIATIPYILSKKRVSGLQRRCEELDFKLNVVQRQLNTSFSRMSMLKDEQVRMRAVIQEMKQRTDDMERDARQRTLEQMRMIETMRSNLRKVLEEMERMRIQSGALEALGPSLADIAAFMHEMELRMGLQNGGDKDRLGIQRLRLRALEVEKLLQKENEKQS